MAACSPTDLLADAGCFACLPDKLLKVIQIQLLCALRTSLDPMATCDVETLLADAAASGFVGQSIETLTILQTQLLCDVSAAIGSGLVAGNQFHGNGSPEGVQVGSPPDLYTEDDAGGRIWAKTSGVGTSTGWV